MTHKILLKILTKQKPSLLFSFSALIVGLYAGLLVWYAFVTYIPASLSIYLLVLAMIMLGINAWIAMVQIPDLLFANEKIDHVLTLPIESHTVIVVLFQKVFTLQAKLCIALFWAGYLFYVQQMLMISLVIVYGLILILFFDLLIFLFCVGIGTKSSPRWVGYIFIALQFIGPIVLLFTTVTMIKMVPMLTSRLIGWIILSSLILVAGTLFFTFELRTKINANYLRAYENVQRFQHKQSLVHRKHCHVQNPYCFLEWKRVTRNKSLLFASHIKNIITILLFTGLLSKQLMAANFLVPYQIEILLLVLCAAVNTISSTAYSSDQNRTFYEFLPLSWRKMFFYKTLNGFVWGELTILLFWIAILFFKTVSLFDALLLLAYGTSINYACVWLGVFFDFKMPHMANSTNELLHGNLSKFYVLIAIFVFTTIEIQLWTSYCPPISLLLFVLFGSVVLVLLEIAYALMIGGERHD